MWEILQDYPSGQIWIFLLELLALVSDAATNVDIDDPAVVFCVPALYLSGDGIY